MNSQQHPPSTPAAPGAETPTPRTNAEQRKPENAGRVNGVLPAAFARQLERELTEAKAERDALKERAATMSAQLDGWEARWAASEVYKKQLAEQELDALGRECVQTQETLRICRKDRDDSLHGLKEMHRLIGEQGFYSWQRIYQHIERQQADLSRWRSLAEKLAGALGAALNKSSQT